MRAIPAWAFAVWSATGLALLQTAPGAMLWWDVVWCLLAAAAAHQILATSLGLNAARVWSLAILAVFALACLMVSAAFSATLVFTAHAGPRIAGVLPVLGSIVLFSIFVFARSVVDRAFPELGRGMGAVLTTGIFAATLLNSPPFLASERLWWIWNPLGKAGTMVPFGGVLALITLAGAVCAWFLPGSPRLQRGRLGPGLLCIVAINLLFGAAGLTALVK